MKWQSEFILVVILPRYYSVALSWKLLQALNEATMQEDLLRGVVGRGTAHVAGWRALSVLCLVSRSGHNSVNNLVDVVTKPHMVLNAVLRHDLDIVLFLIFWEEETESTGADVFPSVLWVKPVEFGAVFLRWKQYMGIVHVCYTIATTTSITIVKLSLKHRLHFC